MQFLKKEGKYNVKESFGKQRDTGETTSEHS